MAGRIDARVFGRVGRDPEVRFTQAEKAMTSFSVAVDKPGKDKGTEWIDVTCFGKTAELVGEYVKKGDRILVDGQVDIRTYESKGQTKAAIRVTADRVTFVESKKDREDQPTQRASGGKPGNVAGAPSGASGPEAGFVEDDLPF